MTHEHTHRARPRPHGLLLLICATLAFSLTGGVASAYWTSGSFAGDTAAVAVTMGDGQQPTTRATVSGIVISWPAVTLSNGTAVEGYTVNRYTRSGGETPQSVDGCSGRVESLSCTDSAGLFVISQYTVTPHVGDHWLGAESPKSVTSVIDPTPPVNALTLDDVQGRAVMNGATVYYQGSSTGSFSLLNSATDRGTGVMSSATSAVSGALGWTHTPSTVSSEPFRSNRFSWSRIVSSPAATGSVTVTSRDRAGNASATTVTFINDSTPPAVHSLSYPGGTQPTRSITVSFGNATDDGGSGVTTRQLQRAVARYGGGTCGAFETFTNVGALNPVSPIVDTSVTNGHCYTYRYAVADAVGNTSELTSTTIAVIDYASSVRADGGLLSYWRLGESARSTTLIDSAGDRPGEYRNSTSLGNPGVLDDDAAATFDGNDDHALIARGNEGANQSVETVELWIRTTTDADQAIFSWEDEESPELWLRDGRLTLITDRGKDEDSFGQALAVNEWYHIALTIDDATARIYINGASNAAREIDGDAEITMKDDFVLGAMIRGPRHKHGYFTGSIDEVAFYSVVVTAEVILAHYELGSSDQ